jgi:hypothetical protein
MRTIRLRYVTIDIWDDAQTLRTTFADGLVLPAAANDDAASVHRAMLLGYRGPDATWQMSRDHEIIHSLLAEALGYKWSPTLHCAAVRWAGGERETTHDETQREETVVLALQETANLWPLLTPAYATLKGLNVEALVREIIRSRTRDDAANQEHTNGTDH